MRVQKKVEKDPGARIPRTRKEIERGLIQAIQQIVDNTDAETWRKIFTFGAGTAAFTLIEIPARFIPYSLFGLKKWSKPRWEPGAHITLEYRLFSIAMAALFTHILMTRPDAVGKMVAAITPWPLF